jgi:hypothetical protein
MTPNQKKLRVVLARTETRTATGSCSCNIESAAVRYGGLNSKMKNKTPIKRRNSNAGKIAKLAQTEPDDMAAKEMARYGRPRSDVEKTVSLYLKAVEFFKRKSRPKDYPAWQTSGLTASVYARAVRESAAELCEMFLDAVNKRNLKNLHDISRAVKKFQFDAPEVDPLRSEILDMKAAFEQFGTPPLKTIEIARLRFPRCDYAGMSDKQYLGVLRSHFKTIDRIRRAIGWTAKKGRPKK